MIQDSRLKTRDSRLTHGGCNHMRSLELLYLLYYVVHVHPPISCEDVKLAYCNIMLAPLLLKEEGCNAEGGACIDTAHALHNA